MYPAKKPRKDKKIHQVHKETVLKKNLKKMIKMRNLKN